LKGVLLFNNQRLLIEQVGLLFLDLPWVNGSKQKSSDRIEEQLQVVNLCLGERLVGRNVREIAARAQVLQAFA